jgi:hypothetical protein
MNKSLPTNQQFGALLRPALDQLSDPTQYRTLRAELTVCGDGMEEWEFAVYYSATQTLVKGRTLAEVQSALDVLDPVKECEQRIAALQQRLAALTATPGQ